MSNTTKQLGVNDIIKQPLDNLRNRQSAGFLFYCLQRIKVLLQCWLTVSSLGGCSCKQFLTWTTLSASCTNAKSASHTCKLHIICHGCSHAQVRSCIASLLLAKQEFIHGWGSNCPLKPTEALKFRTHWRQTWAKMATKLWWWLGLWWWWWEWWWCRVWDLCLYFGVMVTVVDMIEV